MRRRRLGKWRYPKPADRAVLRRAAEGGYFDSVPRRSLGPGNEDVWARGDNLASDLLGKKVRLCYGPGVCDPSDWDWEVFYEKRLQ